jgi:drug/metabolite transporter (DMT)-like permease
LDAEAGRGLALKALPSWLGEFVLLAAIWGSSFLFMRLGALEFGPVTTSFLRVAIAAALMLPIVALQGALRELRQHAGKVLFVGLLNSAIPFACFSYAVMHITTGLASVLNAATPLFGAAIAWLWLKDRPNASRTIGLAVGFIGVAMLASGKASFKPGGTGWAVVACLFATLLYGIAASYAKRYLQGITPMVTATGSQIGAALGLAIPAAMFWPQQTPSLQAWGALLCLSVFCTAIAYWLYFRLMANAGPSKALAVTFLIPVFGVLYGALLLGETITGWMVFCGVVIVVGTALSTGIVKLSRR